MTLPEHLASAEKTATRLQEVLSGEPDPDDIVGLSANQREARHEHLHQQRSAMAGIRNTIELFKKPVARLATCERERDAVRAAEAELERQLAAWPAVAEPALVPTLPRQTPEQRRRGLTASLKALHGGFDRENQIPWPLNVLLDGHFYGSLAYLDRTVAELENQIAVLRERLTGYVTAAEALLAEAPVVEVTT